ncbi:glycosyl hydrolase [Amycolatopsis sp. NPDC004378]
MKKVLAVVAVVLLALGGLAAPAAGAGGKKGVSVNPYPEAGTALGDVGARWFYDWAADPQGISPANGAEFVPMIWGRGSVNQDQLGRAKASGSTLLGFNEPDMAGQANMSVETALALWPQLQDTGMRLGAPAVAYGADVAGGWLDRFLSGAAARGYRVDFIPLHWYGGDFSSAATGQLQSYLQKVHDRYHLPIWLTEYALTDFSGSTPRYPSSAQQTDFVTKSTAMLEGLSFVERYAWFSLSTSTAPTGLYTGATPNASGVAYRGAALTAKAAADHTVTFVNRSGQKLWLGSSVNADGSADFPSLPALEDGQSATVTIPESADPGHWRGKFFGRQGCTGTSGQDFHCAVGDCGAFADHCTTGEQPASLAEFNFDTGDSLAPWYDVSYVNAFSVPITIEPVDASVPPGSTSCGTAGCPEDLLPACPAAYVVHGPDGAPVNCVNPDRDAPTDYSDTIKSHCPKAYAWSKQDTEPGNQTMYQCGSCRGFTVTFH